ncbi:MAG: SRPBCC domain-containing protein [Bacteroidetes bacterium]|nr:MAG: SRPBCC domain-containing protein [Bacteroidota bacterium]
MPKTSQPIVVEQLLNAPAGKVWDAISRHEQLIQWFFPQIPAFEAKVGFETRFAVESGGRTFTHVWRLLEVVPQRKIVYHWSYEEFEGAGTVCFEILPRNTQSLLRLTNEGLENFPQHIPEFSRQSCLAGWQYFIEGQLRQYLEGDK